MATDRSKNNVTNLGKRASTRAAQISDDMVSAAEEEIDDLAEAVLPERKYSLNALIAAGIAGFVLGRLFGR